jgi:hypothetical protein
MSEHISTGGRTLTQSVLDLVQIEYERIYICFECKRATILQMEKSKLTEAEKCETDEKQSLEHAHHFLRH